MSKVPPRKKKKFGSLGSTGQLLDTIRQGIIYNVVTQVLLGLCAMLLPHFAAAIYAGYFVYKFGKEAFDLKRDYDSLEGEPEEKMTILAAREGFKAGVALLTNETVGRQVDQAISGSVQTTSRGLSNSGTLSAVASAMHFPDSSEDLRYFFSTTAERTVHAVYDGTVNAITDYVARRSIE